MKKDKKNRANLKKFQGFLGRKESLKKIKRYADYYPMFYRTNLSIHIERLSWMLKDTAPIILKVFPNFDMKKAEILAKVHDDPEIITGDILLGYKLLMTKQELTELKNKEEKAIKKLVKRWPKKIEDYSYKALLQESNEKSTIEAKVLSFLDKIDAWCESLHELYAGNIKFHEGNNKAKPPIAGTSIKELPSKFSELKLFFKSPYNKYPFFKRIPKIKKESILSKGKPHTIRSIKQKTGIPHYDHWKKITLKYGKQRGLSWLIKKREA